MEKREVNCLLWVRFWFGGYFGRELYTYTVTTESTLGMDENMLPALESRRFGILIPMCVSVSISVLLTSLADKEEQRLFETRKHVSWLRQILMLSYPLNSR